MRRERTKARMDEFLYPSILAIVFPSISPGFELIACADDYLSDFSTTVTTKKTESGEDDRFAFGVSEMQGWRVGAYQLSCPETPPVSYS